MHRRRFMLSALATTLPVSAALPASRASIVGILINGRPGHPVIDAFRRSFATLGYAEAQGFAIEPRYAQGQLNRLPALAAELVQLGVDLIMTLGGPASRAASDATSTIPIVFSIVTDPVLLGLVTSMERPGGNVTGITSLDPEQAIRQFELIRTLFPKLARVGILSDTTIPWRRLQRSCAYRPYQCSRGPQVRHRAAGSQGCRRALARLCGHARRPDQGRRGSTSGA